MLNDICTPHYSFFIVLEFRVKHIITICRIAHNLGVLLMNSNCFAIFFSGIIAMSVQISISICLLNFASTSKVLLIYIANLVEVKQTRKHGNFIIILSVFK